MHKRNPGAHQRGATLTPLCGRIINEGAIQAALERHGAHRERARDVAACLSRGQKASIALGQDIDAPLIHIAFSRLGAAIQLD